MRIITIILVTVALGIRIALILLRHEPASEEVWAVLLAQASFRDIWLAAFSDLHGPGYFMMLRLLQLIVSFPLTVLNLRFISLLFGVASCYGIWYLAQQIGGKKIGLISFGLSLFLPAFIWIAVYGRYYSLLVFLTLLSLILFLKFIHNQKSKFLYLFIPVSIIGLYTHYYFILLSISLAVFLLISKSYRKLLYKFIISISVIAMSFVPGLYYLLTLPKPDLVGRHANSLLKLPALVINNIISSETLIFLYLWENKWLYLPVLLLLTFVTIRLLIVGWRVSDESTRFLYWSVLLVPIIITVIFSYTVSPLLSLGSLQIFMPALIILLAYGIVENNKKLTHMLGITVILSIFFLFKTSLVYSQPRKDFVWFAQKHQAGDLVLHSHLGSYLLASYYGGTENNYEVIANGSVTPLTAKGVKLSSLKLELLADGISSVWYFESPYVSEEASQKVKAFLGSRFKLNSKQLFFDKFQPMQETYFNVYYYKQ